MKKFVPFLLALMMIFGSSTLAFATDKTDKQDNSTSDESDGGVARWTAIVSVAAFVGEVLRVMRAIAEEGRTMLVVTHEMGFARDVSSRVLFLHQGQIEADGPPADLFGESRSERFRQFISRHSG